MTEMTCDSTHAHIRVQGWTYCSPVCFGRGENGMGPLNALRVGVALPFVLAFGPELVLPDFRCSALAADCLSPAGLMAFASQVDPGMVPEGYPDLAIERSYLSSQPLGIVVILHLRHPCDHPMFRCSFFLGGCSLEVPAPHTQTLALQLWRGRGRRRQYT